MTVITTAICRKTVALFGLLHILFSTFGLYVLLETIGSVGFLRDDQNAPFLVESFYTMIVINLLLVTALALAGYRLLVSGVAAITFSNLVSLSEIIYLLLLPVLWFVPHLGSSIPSATGIGNVGIMVQGVVLYPLASLVALSFCRHRLRHRPA